MPARSFGAIVVLSPPPLPISEGPSAVSRLYLLELPMMTPPGALPEMRDPIFPRFVRGGS